MGAEALNTRLKGLPGLLVRTEEPMAKHTPLRVGGPVELWVEAKDQESLQRLLKEAKAALPKQPVPNLGPPIPTQRKAP